MIPYGEWGYFEGQKDSQGLYIGAGHRGVILDDVGEYKILHCFTCILNHVIPLPSEGELARYYALEFFTKDHPDYLSRYEEDADWWALWHGTILAQAESLCRSYRALESKEPYTSEAAFAPLRVLDVGAGPGLFLEEADRKGWKATGIEPSCDSALWSRYANRGLSVLNATLTQYRQSNRHHEHVAGHPYDFIHAWEVLEHVPDPEAFVEDCRALLRPGGVLAIIVPFDYSPLQMLACEQRGLKRWWIAPPQHLNYFTPKTLQLLVRRCGFSIVDLYGTYPLEQFILSGYNYVGDDALGRQCHHERCAWELTVHRAGLWENYLEQRRVAVATPYSGSMGREIMLLARSV